MPFLDAPDTIVAQLTAEARSILARVKTGDVVYRHLGWQLGRGGYQDEFTSSQAAKQKLTVTNFPVQGDTVTIGGAVLTAYLTGANGTTQFEIASTLEDIAENIKAAINVNSTLGQFFLATREGTEVTVECRVTGGIGNFIAVSTSGSWLTLGASRLTGGTGLSGSNPVKVNEFKDQATEAKAVVQVVGLDFEAGDAIVINGAFFAVNVHWLPAETLEVTAQNIVDAIKDSRDSRVYRIVTADLDDEDPTKIIISTYITGAISNSLPLYVWDLEPNPSSPTPNLEIVQAASGGLSTFLQDPAYPIPPSLATFTLPDGKIETPTTNSVSFVCRVPEGNTGVNGYGELGIWAEVVESNFKPEIGEFLVLEILQDEMGVLQFHVHNHGLVEGQNISFSTTGSLPEGMESGRTYYVKNPTADLFEIAQVLGEESLSTDSLSNSGVHTMHTGLRRQFLFAHAHFPLQSKNDRMLLTYRIVVNF